MITLEQYQDLWNTMEIKNPNSVLTAAKIILSYQKRYEAVVAGTHVPWQFVGVTHYREASCNFTRHPHNGDPLTARTVNVPAGRPVAGKPPFTWEESAKDCYLTLKKLDQVTDWSISNILYQIEKFNGLGYQQYHSDVLSPYLWSFTNHYTKGKYASDGKFDHELVDKQVGAAPIYRYLTDKSLQLV